MLLVRTSVMLQTKMIKRMENYLFEAASAIVMALAAGMVALWKSNQASLQDRIAHTERKLGSCEEQHREAMQSIVTLSQRVGNLEGFAQRKHGDFLRSDRKNSNLES